MDERPCQWCKGPLPPRALRFCSKRCRQTAWRSRLLVELEGDYSVPLRIAVADPPYPGLAYLYKGHPDYEGEVDHARLLEQLATFDGWALATSEEGLRRVIFPLLPPEAHICPWVKPQHHTRARGLSCVHEYVVVVPARHRFPGVRDALVAAPARGGPNKLIGRKPRRWWQFVFAALGAGPADDFNDLFTGTGDGQRHWQQFCRASTRETSRPSIGDIAK